MGRPCGTYGENIGAYKFSWGKLKERENLKVSDVDGNIILKYISTKSCGSWMWTGSVWLRIQTSSGLLLTR
jgi:hypothetical protein